MKFTVYLNANKLIGQVRETSYSDIINVAIKLMIVISAMLLPVVVAMKIIG